MKRGEIPELLLHLTVSQRTNLPLNNGSKSIQLKKLIVLLFAFIFFTILWIKSQSKNINCPAYLLLFLFLILLLLS